MVNPAHNELNVVALNLEARLNAAIYDLSEKQVHYTILEQKQSEIQMSQLATSIYFASFIEAETGITEVRRIVKQYFF